tara:strand:+ start:48 stop:218 length:171 start_codon:yes stop_codon:yes gene_type:complete
MIAGVLIYFGLNWIADNPQSVKNIRKMMNEGVATAAEYAGEGLKSAQESATQSIDK